MKIKFLGAAGTVTGSKYLLTTKKKAYLVDCGLFQGLKSSRMRNWKPLDIDPSAIDGVFLTHAHVDHSGYLPRLVAMGFTGPIYCSFGTYELAKILLPDSGFLQEEEARFAEKKGYSSHKPTLPLYTRDQAEESLKFFRPIDFHKEILVEQDAKLMLTRAGHILGASCVLVEAQGRRIVFSGDVGRYNDLIMRPPEPLPDADYLVIESTYGDRIHSTEDIFSRMAQIINRVTKTKGAIVIPAFAVGRAQLILHIIYELKKAKKIPDIKTFLDSPMAINATDLYSQFHDEHRLSQRHCSEMSEAVTMTHTPDESRAINETTGPKIIISASGMASGGRVLHHLAQYLGDEKNTIILVGYQEEGTRGRALEKGVEQIKLFGEYFKVNAKIESLTNFSAHGDSQQLIRWLNESVLKRPRVFVTHGEQHAAKEFCNKLIKTFHWRVEVPKDGAEYDL